MTLIITSKVRVTKDKVRHYTREISLRKCAIGILCGVGGGGGVLFWYVSSFSPQTDVLI